MIYRSTSNGGVALKIAFCSPVSLTNFSGAAKFLINSANFIASRGHEVEVHALSFGPNRNISLSKVEELLTVPYYEAKDIRVEADVAYINYIPFIWRRMRIRGTKVAGLHTHLLLPRQHLSETIMHPLKAGFEWSLKTIVCFAGLPLIRIDLASFDAIHIIGGEIDLRDNSRIYKIPLWIDSARIPRIKEKYETFTVLFAGRKTWEKGWSTFCEISSRIGHMGSDFRFICTGESRNGIHGLGFLSENELLCVYRRSHVVVYPSIADIFGLVILEAAACGTPVITTPIDAHSKQHLPVLYARGVEGFTQAILYTRALWKDYPKKYGDWCKKLQISASRYDASKVLPLLEKMLEGMM
jgi:glycosyltransferase involved in cell wall biosynthesis